MVSHNDWEYYSLAELENILDWEENMKQPYDPGPWAPWYVITWRMVWIIPLKIARELFLLFALLGWGLQIAREMRKVTR